MSTSNLFGSEDPWENGWNDEPSGGNENDSPLGSTLLTPSRLVEQSETNVDDSKLPSSFSTIFSKLGSQMNYPSDFEFLILDKLVENHNFSSLQRTRIMNTIYDQNLIPVNESHNFYQALGLISLELDLEGSGDYVTLQFQMGNLPDLPKDVVNILLEPKKEEPVDDPLTNQFNNTNINDDWNERAKGSLDGVDHILADHSSVQKDQLPNIGETTASSSELNKYVTDYRSKFSPLFDNQDVIHIKEVPEKEGLFFKHINYMITHQLNLGMNSSAGAKKVIRRYSDFVWVLEFLLKKYPFRVVPGLPPKKFNGSSPDSQFLQRRRRGLYRFLNQLIKHPVLKHEPVVITFLSVPTDLTNWRKQAQIDSSLEIKGHKILSEFINSIWPAMGEEFMSKWKRAETNIAQLIDMWTKIVLLVERYEKRQQQIASDNNRLAEMINKFQELDNTIYPNNEEEKQSSIIGSSNKDDVNSINDSLMIVSKFHNDSSQILIDDSYNVNTIVLEKFKNYLDYLYSLHELFDRSRKLLGNNISALQLRIRENEAKFNRLSSEEADIKGSDLAKLKQTIIQDKQEIFQQLNKDWLIKECCLQEFIMFQETQYLISEAWIDWSKGRSRFNNKLSGLHNELDQTVISDMPTSR